MKKSITECLCENSHRVNQLSFMFKEMAQFKWNAESFSFEVCFRTSETMLSLFFCKCRFKWKHVFRSRDEPTVLFSSFISVCTCINRSVYSKWLQHHLYNLKSIEMMKQMYRWLFTLMETNRSVKLGAWIFKVSEMSKCKCRCYGIGWPVDL